MIRDWVNIIEDGRVLKSKQLEEVTRYNTSYLEPIPLTQEILEDNGWWTTTDYVGNEQGCLYFREIDVFTIEYWDGHFQCYDINSIKLLYVHQLQQMLRLCGLTELADNLKI